MNAHDFARDAFTNAKPFEPDDAPEAAAPAAEADGLPKGFRLTPSGVLRLVEKDGEQKWVRLCSPIRVLALPRGRDGRGWGRLVEITDSDGRKHRWAIPAEMFAGDGAELRRVALGLGLDLSTRTADRNAFADLLQRWKPKARAFTAERLGWADDACSAFILGDGRLLGDANVVYQSEHGLGIADQMRGVGTLEGWRAGVAAACVGNPLLLGCVSLAFAGPLLEPLGLEGGGLHLRGASSSGKTTAQRAAVSVWGSPSFLVTWRATDNGLEGVAAACNGTMLALDELGEVSAKVAGNVAYMLANGQGKTRAARTGVARSPMRWRVMFLSSGEVSLADKMAEARERTRAGQEVRLLDLAVDGRTHGAFDDLRGFPSGAAFAEHVKRAAAEHYGTAGPAFVQAVLTDLEGTCAAIRSAMTAFEDDARRRLTLDALEGQAARAVKRFALIAAAGETATALGLTGWPTGEARRAALGLLDLWVRGRGGSGPAEAREAVERTRAFIVAHGASRFERIGEPGDMEPKTFNRAGWRDEAFYYVAPDVWRGEVHAGSDPSRAARHLLAAELLETDGDGRLTRRTPRSVSGRPRAYAVKAEIMGAGDD